MVPRLLELAFEISSAPNSIFVAKFDTYQQEALEIARNNKIPPEHFLYQNIKSLSIGENANKQYNSYIQEQMVEYIRYLHFAIIENTFERTKNTAIKMLDTRLKEVVESSKPKFLDLLEQQKATFAGEMKKFEGEKGQVQSILTKLKASEENLNEINSKLTIQRGAGDFLTLSIRQQRISLLFGVLVLFSVGIILSFLYCSLNAHDDIIQIITANSINLKNQSVPENDISTGITFSLLKYFITRIFFISFLIYFTVFCVKNYNAQMHNSVINKQKFYALQATVTLMNTAKTDQGNDSIMTAASQAIFSHQNTGYGGLENEPPNPNLITNIIDAAGKFKK